MTTPGTTPRNSLIKVLLPIAAIIALVVIALNFLKFETPSHSDAEQVASHPDSAQNTQIGTTPHETASVGATLPDFSLTPIGDAKAANLADFHSKVTIVNFWATWCEACMDEMPSLVDLREAYKSKGLEVIGINLDENASTVVPKAVKQDKIAFPVFQDPENKIADYFDVHAIPLSAVLGAGRKILYIENGERNWNDQETRSMIEKWLASK